MRWQNDPPSPEVADGVFDREPEPRREAEDYWTRLSPHLQAFGISRVADTTGLDRIGFPVAQVVRPGAHSNAVTQGKGATLVSAAIGAVLECLEMAAGEDIARLHQTSAVDLDLWRALAPGLSHDQSWPDTSSKFIQGWDVQDNCLAAIPADLISTDFTKGSEAEAAPLLRHSIGLGAGASMGAATLHGLLECIEADARIRYEASGRATRITLDANDGRFGPLVRLVEGAGLRIAVHEMPSTTQAICVMASIMDPPGAVSLPLPAKGYAARLVARDAISAALAEAVQARLAVISGAREDITHRFYAHDYTPLELEAEWDRHGDAVPRNLTSSKRPASLRDLLTQTGPVFVVPLHLDRAIPLAIVRVLAPDLIADPLRLRPT